MVGISLKFILIFCLFKSVYGQKQRKECYVPARGAVQTVANGEPVADRIYPWHVSINKRTSRSTAYLCGGSIISSDFILTAAHCFYEDYQLIIDERLFIRTGSNKIDGGDYYGINQKIIHKDFIPGNSRADIALLQTSNVMPFTRTVRPVCYTNTDFVYVNKDAWIPGWGLTENQSAGVSYNLNHAKMPGRTRDDCEERNVDFYRDHVTDNSFCAGNLNTTSICTGDSGGGLVMPLSDGWYIRGIASTAPAASFGTPGICDLTKFVLFTDVVSYADWIDDNLSSKNRKSGKRKSQDACDKYIKDGPVVSQDELTNTNSSFREVESAKEFPSNCVLRYLEGSLVCSCSLISDRWVITAAVCIAQVSPTHVLLGAYNLLDYNETGKLIAVKETIIHPLYKAELYNHNIALVKMEQVVKFSAEIHPACLHTDNNGPTVGTELIFAGFGRTHVLRPQPKISHQKNQKVYPTGDCYYKHFSEIAFEIIPNQICVIGVTTSTCQGDTGAPLQLLLNAEKQIFSVVAVATVGRGCRNEVPSISIRVSYYLDWIEGHVWPSSE